MIVCVCVHAHVCMSVFVWVVVVYYCVCEWYIVHVYMKYMRSALFFFMFVVYVSYVATFLSGKILYPFLYV